MRKRFLFRKVKQVDKESLAFQFLVPYDYRDQALKGYHDGVCHLGLERTLSLMRDRFFWPNMSKGVEKHTKKCHRCHHFERKNETTKLIPTLVTHPLQSVHMHYLTIESGKGDQDVNMLIVMDHLTNFLQAFVTICQSAIATLWTLWDKYEGMSIFVISQVQLYSFDYVLQWYDDGLS